MYIATIKYHTPDMVVKYAPLMDKYDKLPNILEFDTEEELIDYINNQIRDPIVEIRIYKLKTRYILSDDLGKRNNIPEIIEVK
jgi:hypothetical protein